MEWAGDFLLTFGSQRSVHKARFGSPWILKQEISGGKLFYSASSGQWKGSPSISWKDHGKEYWLLGTVWGIKEDLHPSDWAGHFILIGHESDKQVWHIWTDRCGTFHAYYAMNGSNAAVGSYFPSVAKAVSKREFDWEGIASFFTFGYFLQDRTYYRDVKIIKPSTHIMLNESGKIIYHSQDWNWKYQPNLSRTFDDSVDEFAQIFHSVMAEQTSGKNIAFPLSGGLDSRSTIAALSPENQAAMNMWSYSYGYSNDSIETNIAYQIAHARGLDFKKFTIEPYLFNRLPQILESVEGYQDITQSRQAAVIDEIGSHADFLVAAHLGDLWFDDMGLANSPKPLREDDIKSYAIKKFTKNGRWLVENICFNVYPKTRIIDSMRQSVDEEFMLLNGISEPDFRLKALKVNQWVFRWTLASIRMFQPGAFPILPYFDPRIVDFFCTVPSKFVIGRKMQVEYLKRYAPDLARINWQVYNANLYNYQYHNSWNLPMRAYNKFTRFLKGQPVIQRNWELQFLGESGRNGVIENLLRPGLMLHDFVSPIKIKELIDGFYAHPTSKDGYVVSMLLTFSARIESFT